MRYALILLMTALAAPAVADSAATQQKIRDAMASDFRDAAEVDRDDNRKPLETLTFFELTDDMRVLELLPGGGWYTKLLAPVLHERGKLYVSIATDSVRDNLLGQPGFDRVSLLDTGVAMERDGPFRTNSMPAFDFGVRDLDLVVTFRNMHNFTPEARGNINKAVFDALKPGGHYGVIDHSRRHMEPMTMENRRRTDVVEIIEEVQAAGFRLAGHSDLHYRPDDELRYEVGRRTVTGNTDRYTLLFEKP